MGIAWFVQRGETVDGPMSTDDVQSRLQSGQLNAQALIWGKGLDAWISLTEWSHELPRLTRATPVEITPELWHYAHGGKSFGPFTKPVLVDELKVIDSLGEVMLWTKGMKEWAPLFEFHELLTAVGVNKRQFPRADLQGRAVIKTGEQTLIGQLVSVSEGGCGIFIESGLVAGQMLSLEIHSPAFRDVLHAKAECRYVSAGIVGLRFTHLSMENKGAIIQYVKQNQTRFVLKAA